MVSDEDVRASTKGDGHGHHPPPRRGSRHHRRHRASTSRSSPSPDALAKALAALRIVFGLTFLWAFFDKLLALGYATGGGGDGTVDRYGDAAWINGGSPTEGFLKFGADGPFKGFYNDIAGATWADWLFMVGLLGIGLALTFGFGIRIAAARRPALPDDVDVVLPPENNPVLDDHIVGLIGMIVLALTLAGDTWGVGRWARTTLVRRYPFLR